MKPNISHIVLLLASFTSSSAIAIERISLGPVTGTINTNQPSREPSVSSDGRYVVFESNASDITSDDTNGTTQDIFRRDRTMGTTELVSRASGASGATADAGSVFSDMSDDGRFIVYASRAQNLTSDTYSGLIADPDAALIPAGCPVPSNPGDSLNLNCERPQQIFLRDMVNNTTRLISVAGGNTSCGGACTSGNSQSTLPSISANGQFIVYESLANNILAVDTDATTTRFSSDVFRYEIATGTTELVSTGANGKGNSRSLDADISNFGNVVVFASNASNLGGNPNDTVRDVFLRNMDSGITIPITNGSADSRGFTDSRFPSVSANGVRVAFESFRRDLVPGDTNGVRDAFVFDTISRQYTRVSVSSNGVQGDGTSREPEISTDGRFVVFHSIATNLVPGDTNGNNDIFLHDLVANVTTRVSLHSTGAEATGANTTANLSSDGSFIVFTAEGSLVPTDTHSSNVSDIYLFPNDISLVSRLKGRNDFDGDGTSDVLWRNSVSAANKVYLMNGLIVASDTALNVLNDTNWEALGIGDFNNDIKSDIVWRNKTTGASQITFMNGAAPLSTIAITGLTTDLNWDIVGVGDFDNDNFDDILIRNKVTGENRVAFMSNSTVTGEQSVNTVNDLNWKVAGIGDFNNDNKADILWRHDVNRRVWMYLMDGNTIINGAGAGEHVAFTSENWDIPSVGDFNNDGITDILWRNNTNGRVWIYLMNSITIVNSTNGGPGQHVAFTALAWNIEAVADYNGDGKDDIFWRNEVFGFNHHYHMDGVSIITNQGVNTLGDLTWDLIKPD